MIADNVRGGESVPVTAIDVSHKAYSQYRQTVGAAERHEVKEWLKNNAVEVRRFADGSPYYIWVADGFRFVFIRPTSYSDDPGRFMLVTVGEVHDK